MSEFDKLTNEAEQYAKDHPEQVRKAEQDAEHAVEGKLGLGGEQGQGGQQDQPDDSGQDTGQQNQNQ